MKSLFPILLLMSLTTLTFANNVLPVANITSSQGTIKTNKLHTKEGITLNFSGASSYDPDGGGINYYWWYVNGSLKSQGSSASSFNWSSGSIYYGAQTSFTVMLKVRDNENTTKTRTITVYVVDEERNYFVTDHLGNVRATVNQNGDVIGYDDYYPYGQVMPGRSSNTANANDIYKFTGHERDAELGLDYMLARNYDPEIGRFLSVDPLYDFYPEWSSYAYAKNNPILMWDPTGMAADTTFVNDVDETGTAIVTASPMNAPDMSPMSNITGKELAGLLTIAVAEPSFLGEAVLATAGVAYIGYVTYQNIMSVVNPNQSTLAVKAPGVPTADVGFVPKRGWDGKSKVRARNGQYGFPAADGSIWVPTGTGTSAHGGPHWDVQHRDGSYDNVYPGGKVRKGTKK